MTIELVGGPLNARIVVVPDIAQAYVPPSNSPEYKAMREAGGSYFRRRGDANAFYWSDGAGS